MLVVRDRNIASVEFRSIENPQAATKFNEVYHMEVTVDEFIISVPSGVFHIHADEISGFTVHYKNGDVLELNREL